MVYIYYIAMERKMECLKLIFAYNFMILIDRIALRNLNGRCDVTFNHIAYERLNFHQICLFPQNIFVMVPTASGKQRDCFTDVASGESLRLEKDHFYFVPNGNSVEYLLTEEITFMTFHFNLELYPGMDLYHGMRGIRSGYAPETTAKFRAIFDDPDEFRSLVRFKEAVMEFCSAHWPENPYGAKPYSHLFQKIRERCSARLSVAELAEEEGITQEAFSRRIRRDLGTTPKKLIQTELLRRVFILLGVPGTTISEVAEKLEFSSAFYLSRFFREQTGMTPSGYLAQFVGKRGRDS